MNAKCAGCGQQIPATRGFGGVVKAVLCSRKFIVLFGAALASCAARWGLDPEVGRELAGVILVAGLGYTGSTALEDAAAKRAATEAR